MIFYKNIIKFIFPKVYYWQISNKYFFKINFNLNPIQNNSNLAVCAVDFSKAFDLLKHSFIEKTLDFFNSINVTAGVPIIRVSPDHGPAFDIAKFNSQQYLLLFKYKSLYINSYSFSSSRPTKNLETMLQRRRCVNTHA